MPVIIGTPAWQYRHWRGRLYPRGLPPRGWLAFYAEGCAPRDARRFAARVTAEGLTATRVPGPRETPVGGSA